MILRLRRKFSAAHKLPEYEGDCAQLHGHTWKVSFEIEGPVQDNGMVCDFKVLKKLLDEALPDHKYLNDYVPNPTAENICKYLFDKTTPVLDARNLKLRALEVWENEDASAILRG